MDRPRPFDAIVAFAAKRCTHTKTLRAFAPSCRTINPTETCTNKRRVIADRIAPGVEAIDREIANAWGM